MNFFKNLILLFALLLCWNVFSQISILETDMLKLGDTARVSEATDPNIDFFTTGPNSEWDFSYLQADWQTLVDPFDPQTGGFLVNLFFGPGGGDYEAEYFLSLDLPLDQVGQFLPVNIEDAFRFTKITEDSLSFVGIAIEVDGTRLGVRSDTIETVYHFPLEYGDTYSSRGYTNANFNPLFDGIFRQYRQRESEVDGFGSVITPLGTFDCIRVHHIINEFDSLYIGMFDTWIPLDLPLRHVYEWWAKDELYPVMRIEVQEINGDNVVSDILYKDIYLGLDASLEELTNNTFKLYPNPANDGLTISVSSMLQEVKVINTNGEIVLRKIGNQLSEQTIDVSQLKRGVYIVHFVTDKGFAQRKFVKY